MLADPRPVPPTAGLLASVAAWFWINLTEVGHVAFLLIAHPPERRPGDSAQLIESRMRGLARALSLAEPSEKLPDIGPRLSMHRESLAVLRLDGCGYRLHIPTGGEWARFVRGGGTVTVAVGLDTLPPHLALDAVEPYVSRSVTAGRLFLGKTRVAQQPTLPGDTAVQT